MSQLRCLTIKAQEPGRLADFYRSVFELKTVSEDPELVRLSDGVFTLAFLKESTEDSTGLHASGFQVEDLGKVEQKSEKGGRRRRKARLRWLTLITIGSILRPKTSVWRPRKPAIRSGISRFTPPIPNDYRIFTARRLA